MKTNGEILSEHSARKGIPLRTLADVQETLERCKRAKADVSMARAMLHHGRLTNDARAWVALKYPQPSEK
jgi:hypothetical protein